MRRLWRVCVPGSTDAANPQVILNNTLPVLSAVNTRTQLAPVTVGDVRRELYKRYRTYCRETPALYGNAKPLAFDLPFLLVTFHQ